jgi:predicted transcriptional regulator
MKQRDDNYHVQIKPEVLFDVYNKFKSTYAPWVYLYLKLDYNNYIFNSPNRFYKIDRKPICEFFNIDPATISRAFSQLIGNGLMEKRKHEYRLFNDLKNDLFPSKEGFPEFVQVNNNFFIDFGERLKQVCEETEDRSLVKAIELFYFLITKNRHVMVDTMILSSNDKSKSLSKSLRHDENYIKKYLSVLETVGQIEIDDSGYVSTVYGCGTCQPIKKFVNNQYSEEVDLLPPSVGEDINQATPKPVKEKERISYLIDMCKRNPDMLFEYSKLLNINLDSIKEYLETKPFKCA